MKILYGVVGEGMGHATRSVVILRQLVAHHEVEIVVSGRAHAFLQKAFPDLKVHEIAGSSADPDPFLRVRRQALDRIDARDPVGVGVADVGIVCLDLSSEIFQQLKLGARILAQPIFNRVGE